MIKIDLKKITNDLLSTFFDAGKLAKRIAHRGVKTTIKDDNTPVTDGDLAVDKILRDKISKLTPQIPIISEEATDLEKKIKIKLFG